MKVIIEEEFQLSNLSIDDQTVDLQDIEMIDSFGIVSLLCLIQTRGNARNQQIILGRPEIQQRLIAAGFFLELKRRCLNKASWNETAIIGPKLEVNNDIFTPIRYGTVSGDERRIADGFKTQLTANGFSEDLLCAGNVIVGEAGANSHTHSLCPSHMMIDGIITPTKSIRIGIADIGKGIVDALRENPDYKNLNDLQALLTALKSNVSGWPEVNRGKGLTEILKWTMAFKGTLRIDSNGRRVIIKCDSQVPSCSFSECDDFTGTRIGVILEDRPFVEVARKNADELATRFLREI